MTLKARITEDMKNAMRAKDATRLSTIRLLLAAMKQREVDERIELTDADVVAIIEQDDQAAARIDRGIRGGRTPGTGGARSAPRSSCCRRTCRKRCPRPRSTR